MKLLRHILSHLFLISFLIAVVSVFYYRSFLLPYDVVGKIDGFVKDVYPPALSFTSKRDYFWSIRGERIVSFDDLKIFKKEERIAHKSQPDEIPQVDSAAKTEKVLEVAKEIEPKKTDVVQSDNESKKELAVSAEKVDEPLPVKVQVTESVEDSKGEELPMVAKDSDASSERELLVNARNSFNQGNISQSEKIYLELTELDHDNADIFGELGNVYYSQGKWDKAGQAYYEAAVRLITEGNHNQVIYLQRVIKGLNTEHAEKLAQLMMRQ